MRNWSTFTNKIILASETPYISGVEGTALINHLSEIKVLGLNFKPDSQVICNTGIISNIQISPEEIIFDCLATTPGSYPIEIRNGNLSSNDWNSFYQPIVIARNSLNITNGWLDFRTANSTDFGSVTSHINQSLSTKTFANSGYTLDVTKGLIIGATGTSASFNNFIQFNSFEFPLSASRFEIVNYIDTNSSTTNRLRSNIGQPLLTNYAQLGHDNQSNILTYALRYGEASGLSAYTVNTNNSFPSNSLLYIKGIYDFTANLFSIYKLNNLSNFDTGDLKFQFPIKIFTSSNPVINISLTGIPLFQFFNSGSLSSVVAIKVD